MTHPDTLQIPRAVVEQALEEIPDEWPEAFCTWYQKLLDFTPAQMWPYWKAALQPQAAVTTSGPPERDNSKPAEQQGVFRKFNVQRTDGSDQPGGKHHGCEYFVLDVAHDQHAKPALEAYAVACATTHPQLSADMRERYGLQPQAAAEPVAWVHDCDALCVNNLRLWIDSCPHCGKPRTADTPPATQAALTQSAAQSICADVVNRLRVPSSRMNRLEFLLRQALKTDLSIYLENSIRTELNMAPVGGEPT